MAQRVLAVLGAVALVLVAIVVRGAIDGGDDDDGPSEQADGEVVVVCSTDLAAACAELDGVRIIEEDAATAASGIADQEEALDGVDGWLTTSAWVEVLDSRAPGRLDATSLIATSPVIVAVDPDRATAVTSLCEGARLWGCLGDNAGAEWGALGGQNAWGALKTGLPSANGALGLSVLASVASGFFAGTDFASNDFDNRDFRGWLGSLAEPSGTGERSPVGTLVTRRGMYTAVGDVSAAVGDRTVGVLEPAPEVHAAVVLVALRGGDRLPGTGPIRDALVAAGWTAASGDAPPAILKPGVMAALHKLWTEVTR